MAVAPARRATRRPTARHVPSRVSAIEAESKRIADAATASPTEGGETKEKKAPFIIGPVQPVGTRRINILVYGPYGHGKTTFAASALDVPSMRDVLFVAAEPGDMSLTDRRDLDIININRYKDLARIFEYLTLHVKWRDEGNTDKLLEWEQLLKSYVVPVGDQTPPVEEGRTWFVEQRLRIGKPMDEPYLYNTVILDSISEMHKYLIYQFTGVNIGTTRLDEDIEKMEEWQPAQELFRLLIRSFRDLKMNFIAVSAEDIADKPDRKKGRRAGQALPKLAGQMAGDIAGFLDIVGYLEREIEGGATTRRLYLGAGYPEFISKHRFENLPDLDFVEKPTLSSLIELARKDEDLHGTSPTAVTPQRIPVTASGNRSRPAATNSSRRPLAASGSRGTGRGNTVRRRAGGR